MTNKKKIFIPIIIGLIILLSTTLFACSLFADIPNIGGPTGGNTIVLDPSKLESVNISAVVANNVVPSCVRIKSHYKGTIPVGGFGGTQAYESVTAGAGFFISKDGYVVTNSHCVVDQKYPKVKGTYSIETPDGMNYESVELIAEDAELDIAVLKVKAFTEFVPLKFVDSDKTVVFGQPCFTVGNPENIGTVFSSAIVANPKLLTHDENSNPSKYPSILLDANINHGNSGGVLVDTNSNVIGVVNARVESKGSTNNVYGLGWAIPSHYVMTYLDGLTAKGVTYQKATVPAETPPTPANA